MSHFACVSAVGSQANRIEEKKTFCTVQALLIGACVAATPVVRRIPKSVLWGYFAYMALESALLGTLQLALYLLPERPLHECDAWCVGCRPVIPEATRV